MEEPTKTCNECGEVKPRTAFHKRNRRSDGVESFCKSCHNMFARRWRARNPERVREIALAAREKRKDRAADLRLRGKYGITKAQWDALFQMQGHACAICRRGEPGGFGWHTDHCHDRNEVRGILCVRCNMALGSFYDSPALLLAAHTYLQKPPLAP